MRRRVQVPAANKNNGIKTETQSRAGSVICVSRRYEVTDGKKIRTRFQSSYHFLMAEGEGFEPPDPCRSSVFKTDAIDLSANLPYSNEKQRNNFNKRKDICQDFFCPFRQTGRSTFSVFYPEKFLTKTGVFVYY